LIQRFIPLLTFQIQIQHAKWTTRKGMHLIN